jgi:tetratricopeptide (TPR) repeat protein
MRGAERYADAIPHYEKFVAKKPWDVGMLYDLANCYEKMGDTAKAVPAYERYAKAVAEKDPAAAERAKKRIQAMQGTEF